MTINISPDSDVIKWSYDDVKWHKVYVEYLIEAYNKIKMGDYIKRRDGEKAIEEIFKPLEYLMPTVVQTDLIGEKVLKDVKSINIEDSKRKENE